MNHTKSHVIPLEFMSLNVWLFVLKSKFNRSFQPLTTVFIVYETLDYKDNRKTINYLQLEKFAITGCFRHSQLLSIAGSAIVLIPFPVVATLLPMLTLQFKKT